MKKKIVLILCVLILLMGVLAVGAGVSAADGTAVIKDAEGNKFGSFEAAVEAASDGAVLSLLNNITEDVNVSKTVTIDLAGYSITGNVTYTNGAKLQLKDSNTDDYTVEDGKGYGTAPYSENIEAEEGYLLYAAEGKASAHAYSAELTSVNQRPSVAGVYFGSCFEGDEIVKSMVAEFGVSLRAFQAPDDAYILADTEYKTHTGMSAAYWTVGEHEGDLFGTILKGILLPKNGDAVNNRNANVPVYGIPYMKLTDGTFLYGADYSFTFKDLVETADGMALTEPQMNALVEMYGQYQSVMKAWMLPNIREQYTQLVGSVTLEGDMKADTVVTAKVQLAQQGAALIYDWYLDGKLMTSAAGNTYHVPATAEGKDLFVSVRSSSFDGTLESNAVKVGALSGTKMTFAGLYSDLKILGRTPVDGTGISTAFPGTGFSMNVKSIGSPMKLGFAVGTTATYFCVEVDGVQVDRTRVYGTMEYTLELSAGNHTVTVWRDSANSPNVSCKVEYINFAGEILEKPANKELYIEVIGDSIASGLGSLGTFTPGQDWINLEHSVSNSFGWYVAEDFGADISVIAKGGIGAVKEALNKTMLEIYPYVNGFTGTDPYDFARKPDLVIVELGANDGASSTADYTAALKEMYQMIFDNYGEDTKILWVGKNTRLHGIAAGMNAVFGGNCYAMQYSYGVSGSGPDNGTPAHPDDAEHRAWADAITQFIRDYHLLGE